MKKISLFIITACIVISGKTQNKGGHFGGSFETYTQIYQKDDKIGAILPTDRVGSNNYLKLDYTFNQFAAGVQFEAYLPAVAGYPFALNEGKLINKYFKYTANKFSIQVGDFYEQFGSGLVFRAWENRQIGINNALEGANVHVSPLKFLHLKAIYGRQRKIFDYTNSNVRGIDAEIELTKESSNTRVATGFSFVNRYQEYTGPDPNIPPTVNATSMRLDIGGGTASLSLEYVHKNKDPHDANLYDPTTGKSLYGNLTLAKNNFGANFAFRAMENMDYRSERELVGSVGLMNYIPALTKQHDYLTTNIYVYSAQSRGEIGGQMDLFYNAEKGTGLGGKHGSKFSLNFSHYRGLENANKLLSFGETQFFHDLNFEWKKKWSEKFTSIFLYQNIFYNRLVIEGVPSEDVKAHTIVLNSLLRLSEKRSFRFELQHLGTDQDKGNWAAAVTEFSFAPKWTFFLSDLYNYGDSNIHYPTVGGSYAKSGTRFGLSYGRQRAGLYCVGGVCRFVPAATGITATLTTTFN